MLSSHRTSTSPALWNVVSFRKSASLSSSVRPASRAQSVGHQEAILAPGSGDIEHIGLDDGVVLERQIDRAVVRPRAGRGCDTPQVTPDAKAEIAD